MSSVFSSPIQLAPAKKARIEIIPLIDVIFFLLATFVLFTLSLNKIQSIPVNLPQASASAAKPDEDTTVVIQRSDEGTAYWNKELITLAEITPRLVAYKSSTPTARVLVTGDERARYGNVIRVLDEVRLVGIKTVTIETAFRATGR